MKRFFVTGTDTDCGKTYVTSLLQQHYPKSLALKPVASGCALVDGELVSSDAVLLQKNQPLSLEVINPWRFAAPVSPHIAAAYENRPLSLQALVDYCLHFQAEDCEHLFIEGAGGLMVPLVGESTWVDFLWLSQIPVILVVGMRLGCINHALLTQVALEARGIACVGWVANCLDREMLALEENIATLEQALRFPLLGVSDFAADPLSPTLSLRERGL